MVLGADVERSQREIGVVADRPPVPDRRSQCVQRDRRSGEDDSDDVEPDGNTSRPDEAIEAASDVALAFSASSAIVSR